jgi:hypothetical protein
MRSAIIGAVVVAAVFAAVGGAGIASFLGPLAGWWAALYVLVVGAFVWWWFVARRSGDLVRRGARAGAMILSAPFVTWFLHIQWGRLADLVADGRPRAGSLADVLDLFAAAGAVATALVGAVLGALLGWIQGALPAPRSPGRPRA